MPKLHRSALVMHSAQTMYTLVNDVEQYPTFLAGCGGAKLIESSEHHMVGSIQISKGGISKWLTTRNTLVPYQSIEMTLVNGPFKKLIGIWSFDSLDDDACKVSLDMEFEFSSKLVELAFGKIFNQIANNMVKSFVERAKSL